jgi:hypothetical protein
MRTDRAVRPSDALNEDIGGFFILKILGDGAQVQIDVCHVLDFPVKRVFFSKVDNTFYWIC